VTDLTRRDFLQVTTVGTAIVLSGCMRATPGPAARVGVAPAGPRPMTHAAFWRTTHDTCEAFVREPLLGQFPLIDPGFDPARSLLIQVLRGVGPLPRMPMSGPPLAEEAIQRIERWIAARCPEAEFPEIQEILDGLQASGVAASASPVAPATPRSCDMTFAQVRDHLEATCGEDMNALHGRFWNRLSHAELVAYEVPYAGGHVPLLRPYDGAGSALVQALRGTGSFRCFRMPLPPAAPGVDAATLEKMIARIETWIDSGCPE